MAVTTFKVCPGGQCRLRRANRLEETRAVIRARVSAECSCLTADGIEELVVIELQSMGFDVPDHVMPEPTEDERRRWDETNRALLAWCRQWGGRQS